MPNSNESVIIVGSGPCGLLAAKLLIEENMSVILLDIGSNIPEQSTSKKTSALKNISGSIHPYDWDNQLGFRFLSKDIEVLPSKGLFGFSSVWGATWDRYESLDTKLWNDSYIQVEKILSETSSLSISQTHICDCFKDNLVNLSAEKMVVFDTKLAISTNKCISCGACQIGCAYNAIWSSSELFESIKHNENFTYIPNIIVDSFRETKNNITVLTSDKMEFIGKHLFLAAGPLPTGKILLKSNVAKRISLSDTQICYVPLISFAKSKDHLGSFALSTKSVRLKKKTKSYIYIQFYSHLNDSLVRIASNYSKFFGLMLNFITKVLKNRIRVGLVYFSPKVSRKLVLSLLENDRNICLVSKEGNFSLLSKLVYALPLCLAFFRFKFFPVLLASKWGGVGSSYHLGSCLDLEISENGFIENYSRMQIIGSLPLKEIEVGPITATLLAQTVRAVNSFLNQSITRDDN